MANLALSLAPSVVALASVGVSALAVRGARATTTATLRHQLGMAREERVWRERSAAYLELLKWMAERDDQIPNITGDWETASLPPDRQVSERETLARIQAYGSREVNELLSEWRRLNAAFVYDYQQMLHAKIVVEQVTDDKDAIRLALLEETRQFVAKIDPIEPDIEAASSRLHEQIRRELLDHMDQ
ncbi:MAG: hypothetical protein ACRDRJ_05110 [Streptosporangiaceae bacterium]